jgi:hypothetical protein
MLVALVRLRGRKRKGSVFRFASESGPTADISACPLCANGDRTQRSNKRRYSITSSARASSADGRVRPSVFAVFRLTRSTNFVA